MEKYPLWTALITPMHTDGTIDYNSLENLLRKQEKAGNGILVLGSTGEGLNLSLKEKQEVVRFAKDQNLAVPLMAGIGGHLIENQIEFIHYCDKIGVDAFLLVTPLYARPGVQGQIEWFSRLFEETKTPCMVYNVPARTGTKMYPEVPARLYNKYPHYMGLKEAGGSVEEFKKFREAEPNAKIYSGDDGLLEDFVAEGAVGLVSVSSNCWPEAVMKYVKLTLEGKTDLLYEDWQENVKLIFGAPNPIPAKVLAHSKGWISSPAVHLPLSLHDISEETKAGLDKADKKIRAWAENLNG